MPESGGHQEISALQREIEELRARLARAEEQAASCAGSVCPGDAARKFRFIADSSRDFMTLINAECEYEAANQSYLAASGLQMDQIVGRTVSEVWGAEVYVDSIKPYLDRAFAGEHVGYECWFAFHARGRGYFKVTYSPYISEDGQVTHVSVISHDMTDFKLARDALKEQEQHFRSIVDNIPDIVYRLDSMGRITFVNNAVGRYGYSPEELKGKHILELLHPEDRDRAQRRVDERRTGDRSTASLELRLRTKSGALVDMEMRSDSLETDPVLLFNAEGVYSGAHPSPGCFVGTQGLARDVTEARRTDRLQRERESLYKVMFDNTGTGMASIAPDGTIQRINGKFEELSGWANDEVAGTEFLKYVAPAHREMAAANYSRRLAGEDVAPEYEMDFLTRDGRILHGFVQVGLLPESRQCIVSVVDLTQRVLAEEEMRRACETAEQANRIKNEFLANMSHEVRTPLNGILGMAELVMLGELDDEQKECLEMIRESGRNLLSILNDLLDISKIEAGRLETERREFVLSDVLRQVEVHFGAQATRQGLEFSVGKDEASPDAIVGDDVRLRQVLFNLVGNSLKFTDHGGIEVRAETLDTSAADGGNRLLFSVRDTGIGISDEFQRRVFEPFTQADGSFTRKYQGTGLGLGIVRRLVQLMGGQVCIDSNEGQGTTVHFTLPVDRAVIRTEAQERAVLLEELPALTVLVAEDNAVNRIYAERVLKDLGHKVVSVVNGREAIEALEKDAFDMVFMDISMPEMNGLEATRLIRAGGGILDSRVPIVAMTAHAMKGDREKFMEAGMDGYLPKPMEREDVATVMLRVLSRAAMRGAEFE